MVPNMVLTAAAVVLTWRYGFVGLLALAPMPLVIVRAWLWAKHAGYAEAGGLVAVREGWIGRSWRFAEVAKLQALRITESPFDRRHGMATLWLDTAGADAAAGVLRVPYLPRAEAFALHDRLAGKLDEGLGAG
jgi:putative membrane protein